MAGGGVRGPSRARGALLKQKEKKRVDWVENQASAIAVNLLPRLPKPKAK